MGKISRNPELADSREPRGYWPQLMPGICGSELGTQVCVPEAGLELLRPESKLGLIRAGLVETKEAVKDLPQKATSSSKSVT